MLTVCPRCTSRYPGDLPIIQEHAVRHSGLLDACIDEAILAFVEGFNRDVAATANSCQGGPLPAYVQLATDALPARANRFHSWLTTAWSRYPLTEVTTSARLGTVLHFSDTPVAWLG